MKPKRIDHRKITGQLGVNLIERIALRMKYLWHPSNSELNVGIDGVMEICDPSTESSVKKDEQQTVRAKLASMLSRHEAHVKEPQTTYDHAVKSVLSQPYSGAVSLQGEVDFQIRHGTTMAGEAIVTLAVLLADVCAMLLGAAGRGCHPGMVIHDSPREADLGSRIYRSYLLFVAGLHNQLGGPSEAPFQYVVTTTTAPPNELHSDEHLRLRLHGDDDEGLLFRKDLGSSADDESDGGQMLLRDAGDGEQ